MIAPDLGSYFVDERPMCLSAGELAPRRSDVGKPKWGRGGTAAVTTRPAIDNLLGIASTDKRAMCAYQTEQGPIGLCFGPDPPVGYMPSVTTLASLPDYDTRATAISDRYYR